MKVRIILLLFAVTVFCWVVKAQNTVTVNWTDTHQTIDGFGAASAFTGTGITSTQADLFFTTVGLSLLRVQIQPDNTYPELNTMQLAIARGAKVWGTPWTPPANMKTNNSLTNGGSLCNGSNGCASQYAAYATYLTNYVKTLQTNNGITLYALSVQNEPDLSETFRSATWTAQNIHDFVLNNLGPTMATSGLNTKIMMPEPSQWGLFGTYGDTTLNDNNAAAFISIAGSHQYEGSGLTNDPSIYTTAANKGKNVWETEVSSFDTFNGTISNGLIWAQRINDWMTIANANAWHWWWLIDGGNGDNEALLSATGATTKRLFVLGNYAKFVRPGFVRIGATATPATGVSISAYKDPSTGNFAIVAVNNNASASSQTFTFTNAPNSPTTITPWVTDATRDLAQQSTVTASGGAFTYSLPASSVTTFAGVVAPGPSGPGPLALPTTPGWHQIPFSELNGPDNTSPCPPDNATSPFNPVPPQYLTAPCSRVVNAYSSAIADYARNRLILWGGGHNDYGGNELYSLELTRAFQSTTTATNPAIIRLTNPSTPNTNTLNADCTDPTWTNQSHTCDVETLLDGRPNARHTGLSAIIYSPNTDQLISFGGSLNDHGSSPGWNVHSLDGSTPATLNTNGYIWGLNLASVLSSCAPTCNSNWTALNTTSNVVIIQESAFDPNTGLFYVLPNIQGSAAGPYSFNPKTNVWTQVGNNSLVGNAPELAMDPEDHILLYAGAPITLSDTNCGVSYMSTATGSNFAIQFPPGCGNGLGPLPGCPNFANWPGNGGNTNSYWPGLVYDEKSRKFLLFGGANGGKIVVLDPKTWTCYTETYGSTQGVDQPLDIPLGTTVGGAWVAGHFQRFPNLNQEVLMDLGNHNAWTLKRRVGEIAIGPFSTAQTNYVYSRGQAFAKGDIPNWPTAYVDGVQIAVTQFDVKNRWPDGSAKYGIVSFVIPSIAANHVAFANFDNSTLQNNTGFLAKADMLGAAFNFDAQIQMTGPTSPAAISARTILNTATSCVAPGTDVDGTITANLCTYWLQGPVVTSVILEDRSAARSFDVKTDTNTGNPLHPRFSVDFYPQGNMVRVGYNLENEWASSTSTLSARDQTINSITFTGGNGSPVTEYTQSTSFVSHPATYLRHTYCINGTGAGQQNFCGTPTHIDMNQAYLESTMFFPNYDTIVLGAGVINGTNGAIGPNTSSIFGGCPSCYSGNGGIGGYINNLNSGGWAPTHGTMDGWELVWLISQADNGTGGTSACSANGTNGDLLSLMLCNSDFGGNLPFFWRETDHNAGHGQSFDNSGVIGNVETRGRMVSLNARQQVNFLDPTQQASFCTNSSAPFDWIQLPGNTFPMGNWSTFAPSDGTTHWPDIAYPSYIATGEYDYYTAVLQQGDYAMGWGPGCSGFTSANTAYLRQGSTGYINYSQERGNNWALRNLAWAAFVAADGSPEQAYLGDKLYNNLAVLEGIHDITLDVPSTYGTTTERQTAWNFGNASTCATSNPGRHDCTIGQSPLQFWYNIPAYVGNKPLCGFNGTTGCTVPTVADSNFQAGYSGYVRGLLVDLGFSSQAPLSFMMKNYIHRMLDPTANQFAIGDYVFPTQGPSGWVSSYANQQTFIYPPDAATSAAGYTGAFCTTAGIDGLDEPYALMTPAVLSYGASYLMSDGSLTAASAYAAARSLLTSCVNGTGGAAFGFATGSPKWDLVPRNTTPSAASAPVGPATNLYLAQTTSGTADGSSCTNPLAASYFNSSANWGTGITQIGSGTTVHLCGSISTTLTTPTSQGTGTVVIKFETGAKLSQAAGTRWIVLDGSMNSWVIDGGTPCGNTPTGLVQCNGQILNTAMGSNLANQVSGTTTIQGITGNSTTGSITIKNLEDGPLYQHVAPVTLTSGTSNGTTAVAFTCATTCGFVNGETHIDVGGSTNSAYNVTGLTVASTSGTSLTLTYPATVATGSGTGGQVGEANPCNTCVNGYSANPQLGNLTVQDSRIHDTSWALTPTPTVANSGLTMEVARVDFFNNDHQIGMGTHIGTANSFTVKWHDSKMHDYTAWDSVSNNYHHDGIHLFGNQNDSTWYTYNNLFVGPFTGNTTAFVFIQNNQANWNEWNNVGICDSTCTADPGSLWDGGAGTNAKIFNNTVKQTGLAPGAGPNFLNNGNYKFVITTGDTTGNETFMNNLLTDGLVLLDSEGVTYAANSTTTGLDYNLYANSITNGNKTWNWNGTHTTDFPTWQGLSGEGIHSSYVNNSNVNASGIPQTGSAAIGTGTNLTTLCSGNMVSLCSDTSAGNTRVPVARPTTGPWDIGAYFIGGAPAVPGASLSPSTVSFSNQLINKPAAGQPVTLTNTGGATLNITSIVISGGSGVNGSAFAQTNTCGLTLAAGSSCIITVTFSPTIIGSGTANLVVTDNAPNTPQSVSMSGSGVGNISGVGTISGSGTIVVQP